jgi:hypothetical protein
MVDNMDKGFTVVMMESNNPVFGPVVKNSKMHKKINLDGLS